jgi:DHA1 family tetracycline resistance protein-like MFS transporter
MKHPTVPHPARHAAVAFILVTLAIDALGFGIVIPILPELVRTLSGLSRSQASFAMGASVAMFAFAQLFAAPLLGGLSDRFGRRPVILLSVTGMAANYLLLAWAPSLPWLYLGRLLAGATAANVSTATAYIADISPPELRARRFGLIGATFSFGFVIGPALGGWLGAMDLRLPFMVSAALAGCNALYGLFVLPESLAPEHRQAFQWRGANPISALHLLTRDAVLKRLALAWACMWFGIGAIQTVFVLSTGLRFGWGPQQNGGALALVGVSGALVQIFLVRRATAKLGERGAAMLGQGASVVAYLGLAFAPVAWVLYPAIIVNALGQLANPAVRSLISARAGPDNQGHVMGGLSVVEGLTAIVSPVLASVLFSQFSGPNALLQLPGLPFLVASAAFVVAIMAVHVGPARSVRVAPVVVPPA